MRRLSDLEDNAQEIKHNPDGSVTFTFDEPGSSDPETGRPTTGSVTISKEDYEAAQKNPNLEL